MSQASVQFAEMIRIEHARIEYLKEIANERGEIIVNLTAAFTSGEISQEEYDDLIARACEVPQAQKAPTP